MTHTARRLEAAAARGAQIGDAAAADERERRRLGSCPAEDADFPRASARLEARVAWALDFLDGQLTAAMRADKRVSELMLAQRQVHQGRLAA